MEPIPVAMSKLFLKIWDLLNQNYNELTATRKIKVIAMDVSGLPSPVVISRLVNHYVSFKLGYDPFSEMD